MTEPVTPDARLEASSVVPEAGPDAAAPSPSSQAQPIEAAALPPAPSPVSSRPRRRGSIVRLGLLIYVPVALLSAAWLEVRLGTHRLRSRVVGPMPLRDAFLGAGVGLMVVGLSRLVAALWSAARRAEGVLGDAIGPLTPAGCLTLALASGVGEEMLFRGVLQPVFGIILTSFVFGLAHVPLRRELIAWPAFAVIMGFVLGWMFQWTGALVAPVLAHVTVNALNLRFIAPRAEPVALPA